MKIMLNVMLNFCFMVFFCSQCYSSDHKNHAFLDRKVFDQGPYLTKEEVRKELVSLKEVIDKKYAYASLNAVPYQEILKEIEDHVDDTLSVKDLSLQLQAFVSLFGDGHAGVLYLSGKRYLKATHRKRGYLPFGMRRCENTFIAINPHEKTFFVEDFPFIKTIEGVAIQDWMKHARMYVTDGSDIMKDARSLEIVHHFDFVHRIAGAGKIKDVDVLFANESGETIMKTVSLGRKKFAKHKHRSTPVLNIPDNISYLKIPHMDNDKKSMGKIRQWLETSQGKEAAIIDLRGNTGGRREPLQVILPHVMSKDERPYIATIAAYKMSQKEQETAENPEGYLSDRFLFPKSYSGWGPQEITSINTFMETFEPKWQLPEEGFSKWHFNIIKPAENPALYGKPLVILMDHHNFSAADIFLHAFKGRKNVTLIGTPSKGGSARAQYYRLPSKMIKVRLATIASYKRDGHLYDGNPTMPDIMVSPTPQCFIEKTDKILESALSYIKTFHP